MAAALATPPPTTKDAGAASTATPASTCPLCDCDTLPDNLKTYLDRLVPAKHVHVQEGKSLVPVDLADERLVALERPVGHDDPVTLDDGRAHWHHTTSRGRKRLDPRHLVAREGSESVVTAPQEPRESRYGAQLGVRLRRVVRNDEQIAGKQDVRHPFPLPAALLHELEAGGEALLD